MLRKIRQVVTGLVEEKRQDAGWDLEPGKGFDPTLQVKETQPVAADEPAPEVGTFDPDAPEDYVAGVMKASIVDGGKYGEYRIPVWWLKATLADLEGRYEDSRLIWERSALAASSFEDGYAEEDPILGRLFGAADGDPVQDP